MTRTKFRDIIARLEKYYSGVTGRETGIEPTTLDDYYHACFCVFDDCADKFYSSVVGECKYFPKIPEFREHAEKFRRDKKKLQNTNMCYFCMNTGIVTYAKKGMHPFPDYEYEFVTRCTCELGRNRPDWPISTRIIKQDELEWLWADNRAKYGNITHEEMKSAEEYVTRFIRRFA